MRVPELIILYLQNIPVNPEPRAVVSIRVTYVLRDWGQYMLHLPSSGLLVTTRVHVSCDAVITLHCGPYCPAFRLLV